MSDRTDELISDIQYLSADIATCVERGNAWEKEWRDKLEKLSSAVAELTEIITEYERLKADVGRLWEALDVIGNSVARNFDARGERLVELFHEVGSIASCAQMPLMSGGKDGE